MYENKKIGIVVPAHNEEKMIAAVIKRAPEYADCLYIIDDCSTDNTASIVESLAASTGCRIRLLRHTQNGGVGKAITTGYKACLQDNVDIAVVMAGDNQMDPAQLPRLLEPVLSGKAEYSVGDRISSLKHMKGMSYWRRSGNVILRWLTRIAAGNRHICDPQNGYTAITREGLSRLDLDHIYPRYGYCNDMLVKLSALGARIVSVSMPAVYGGEKSQIKYWHYIPTVSWLLLKGFLWRLRLRCFPRRDQKHPAVIIGNS
jgi:glycosyltransferase involved in cell wall biosynthesis